MNRTLFLCTLFSVLTVPFLWGQVPQTISYQGVLTDVSGNVVSDGNYTLTFKLYEAASGGTSIWSESQVAAISHGIFNVRLGSANPLNRPFDKPYWLGITVGTGTELSPRIQLTASAYGLQARSIVDNAVTSNKIADGAVTTSKLNTTGASAGQALMYNGSNVVWDKPAATGLSLPFKGQVGSEDGGVEVHQFGTGAALEGLNLHGLMGFAEGPFTESAGVRGFSHEGYGVHGSADGFGTGVFGRSVDGKAVWGITSAALTSAIFGVNEGGGGAIEGHNNSSLFSAVYGVNSDGNGVFGVSTGSGYGVWGKGTTDFGGFFSSDNDHADLGLGGIIGRINTDPSIPNSVLILSSNYDVIVRLDNNGGENGVFRVKNSGGNDVCTVDENGKTTTKVLEITGGSDLSEQFDVVANQVGGANSAQQQIQPGMVVSIDAENPGKLVVSSQVYDRKVAGIISGAGGVKPGMLMGQFGSVADGQYPVALTGRVYCYADASNGVIEVGDLLTTSETPGHAMKVSDHSQASGAIIGKAMTPLTHGKGLVLVLVTLQ